ncbi:MAG: hypothetical protein IJF58_06100 [Clostridia bacterium]|nr:hypothetical protein [Clostridia bacterium]
MKRILSLLLCLCLLFCASGCSGSDSASNVRIAMGTLPVNIDPQLAESGEELAIVRNCFEGLFRFDGGKIKKAACSDYSVSEDGLTWTFTLRKGAKWSDGKSVSAKDFVFGIQRALNPDTIAPYASLLYCIKGGESALKGEADPSTAAVYDKGGKVVIELVSPQKDLPEILSKAMCMPCREDVFTMAGGRYGMSSELIVCNGPYYLASIDKSVYILKNEHYKGDFKPLFNKTVFTYGATDSEKIESLSNDISALSTLSGSSIDEAKQANLDLTAFNDTAWMVVINPAAKVVGDSAVASALKSAVDSHSYADALPTGFEVFGGVVAPRLTANGKDYRSKNNGLPTLKANENARDKLVAALKSYSGKMPTLTMLYPEGYELKVTAARLAQQWQQLGVIINIEAVGIQSLNNRLASGDYQIALCSLSADDGNAVSSLRAFAGEDGNGNFGFTVDSVTAAIGVTGSVTKSQLEQAEKELLKSPHVMPIAVSGHYYVHTDDAKKIGLDMHQGGIKLYK